MWKLILVLLVAFCWLETFSQQTVRGYVLDANSKEPLVFAHVVLNDGLHGATTDLTGFFEVKSAISIEKVRLSTLAMRPRIPIEFAF